MFNFSCIWAIYARFGKKMGDCSQLIILQTLALWLHLALLLLEKNLDAHQVISILSCFLADKECTYFHILVDLNFSNWILWILGDFHLSNWFLGEKNLPSYFSNIAPVQSHLLRQKFATAKWKYVRPGIGVKVTQSTYWKFSSLSHDMIEPRTIFQIIPALHARQI